VCSNADSKAETCRLTQSDRQSKDGPGCHNWQWKPLIMITVTTIVHFPVCDVLGTGRTSLVCMQDLVSICWVSYAYVCNA